jgi:aryl-alcohol dehydrogenase-like predicted oxidoreductase
MMESLETSLRLLRTDHVDIWMIHSIDAPLLRQREVMAQVFAAARRRGQIGWTGASFYGAALPQEALDYDLFDVIQITYSVLDQRLDERVLPLADERNVGVVARSILLKGVLTERAERLPPHLAPLRERSRRFRALLATINGGMTPPQGAIAFGLANPRIDTVLVGVRTEAELAEDLAAVDMQLTPQELNELQALGVDDESLLDPSRWGIP